MNMSSLLYAIYKNSLSLPVATALGNDDMSAQDSTLSYQTDGLALYFHPSLTSRCVAVLFVHPELSPHLGEGLVQW